MPLHEQFASLAATPEELPPPFSGALRAVLCPDEVVDLMIHSPFDVTGDRVQAASVLAVTDRRCLLVSAEDDAYARLESFGFEDVLLIELSSVLLLGRLRFDYVELGRARPAALEFSTVRTALYEEAVRLVLRRLGDVPADAVPDAPLAIRSLGHWPLKFRNLARRYLPGQARLRGAVYWPAEHWTPDYWPMAGWPRLFGELWRERSPAAALLLTDDLLLLLEEEPADIQGHRRAKLGQIVSYYPRCRLAGYHLTGDGPSAALHLHPGNGNGGAMTEMALPSAYGDAVHELMSVAGVPWRLPSS